MSIVSIPSSPVESRECEECHAALYVGVGTVGPVLCMTCRQGHAAYEALKLVNEAKALASGQAPYDVLTPEERAEQICQLLHVGGTYKSLKYPGFKKMTDQQLIDIVADPMVMPGESVEDIIEEATAELVRRLSAPTEAERQDIEQRIEAMGGNNRYLPGEQIAYAPIHEDPERFDGLA